MATQQEFEDSQKTVEALAHVQQLLVAVSEGYTVYLPKDASGKFTGDGDEMAAILKEVADEGLHKLYSM